MPEFLVALLCGIIVFATFLAVLIIASMGGGSDNEGNTENTNVSSGEAVISYVEVSAADLMADYKDNEVAVDAAYKNKQLKITGTVGSIGKNFLDQVYVLIETGEFGCSIQCNFTSDEQINAVAALHDGDTVTIVGKCSGLSLFNIILNRCEIIN